MKNNDEITIRDIPSDLKPVGAWTYYGYRLLFALPIVGLIALIICASSSYNVNVRRYARSYFCSLIIDAIVIVVLIVLLRPYVEPYIEEIKRYLEQLGGSVE